MAQSSRPAAAATSKWRTLRDVQQASGLIGPNAVLQLLPVIDRLGGRERRAQMLARAGNFELPDGTSMIPEGSAARLHRQLRLEEPEIAPVLSRYAGAAPADYILAHRLPRPVQQILKSLPPMAAAAILSRAIARNAWTFVGSGTFHRLSPTVFEIEDNPLIAGERSETCLCQWHEGVFERLYRKLVAPDFRCVETQCGAQAPGMPCRFELYRQKGALPSS